MINLEKCIDSRAVDIVPECPVNDEVVAEFTSEVAQQFNVETSRVTDVWNTYTDRVFQFYRSKEKELETRKTKNARLLAKKETYTQFGIPAVSFPLVEENLIVKWARPASYQIIKPVYDESGNEVRDANGRVLEELVTKTYANSLRDHVIAYIAHTARDQELKEQEEKTQNPEEKETLLNKSQKEYMGMWAVSGATRGVKDCNQECYDHFSHPRLYCKQVEEKWVYQFMRDAAAQRAWEWMDKPVRVEEMLSNSYWSEVLSRKKLMETLGFSTLECS